jgi:LPXTG-site transpeptidase (sortase) family protein
VGRLQIARLGLVTIVEEGVDQGTLRRAAGHLPGTAFPGETGNVVVAAHRDTFFRPLNAIRPGDSLRFVTPDGEFRYVVFALDVVEPASTDVLEAGDGHQATLITCYPFGYVGPAPRRLVVRASLAETRARADGALRDRRLAEDVEGSEKPPQQQEDEYRAEAAASELLRAPARRDSTQYLAHGSTTILSTLQGPRRPSSAAATRKSATIAR